MECVGYALGFLSLDHFMGNIDGETVETVSDFILGGSKITADGDCTHEIMSPSPPAFNLASIRVFSNESVLLIRWPKNWSFSFSISPSNEYSGLISFSME